MRTPSTSRDAGSNGSATRSSPAAAPGEDPMTIRIGINPITWSNDDMPELGADTPLETCLAEAARAGYDGVEKGHKFPSTASAMNAALEPHGLRFVSGWHSIALLSRDAGEEFRHARADLDLLRGTGAGVMIVCETSNTIHTDRAARLSRRPMLQAGEWQRFGERLTAFARALRSEGIRLVYHHHMGTVVQTSEEIELLMENTGAEVQLLLDTGHAAWGGSDPAALAARHRDRIGHVHCKDIRAGVRARADREDWSFLDSVLAGIFTVPGDGSLEFPSLFRNLRNYDGWVVVEAEQDPAKAHPLTCATMGHRNLAGFLSEAGLR